MTAREAREKALNVTLERDQNQIKDFHEYLSISIDDGNLSFIYYKPLSQRVIEHFENRGFKITTVQTGMNENSYKVEY